MKIQNSNSSITLSDSTAGGSWTSSSSNVSISTATGNLLVTGVDMGDAAEIIYTTGSGTNTCSQYKWVYIINTHVPCPLSGIY